MNDFHRARKRFGQNFLHDKGIIQRIVNSINPKTADHIIEIGPGKGAITELVAATGCQLDLIELDRDLVPFLKASFGYQDNIRIHQADALEFDFAAIKQQQPMRIIGNLPYNISTPLIFHLLEYRELVSDMHFMLQKEVVKRMTASPGNKSWGRLGVMTQYYCQAESLFDVPPECFSPRPKVDSAIIRLKPHDPLPCQARDEQQLDSLLRDAFGQRRKTLRNSLKTHISAEKLESLGIESSRRPETLSLQEFVTISD